MYEEQRAAAVARRAASAERRARAATRIAAAWRGWRARHHPLAALWHAYVAEYRAGALGVVVPSLKNGLAGLDPRELFCGTMWPAYYDARLPKELALPPRARHFLARCSGWRVRLRADHARRVARRARRLVVAPSLALARRREAAAAAAGGSRGGGGGGVEQRP